MKKQSELFPTTTLSVGECHVKVGVPPVNKKARKMTATSGRQCLKLLKAKDPLMLLSKTLMVSSPWEGPTSYQMTWKPKATLRRRLLFQLYPSKLPTGGIESGSSGKKPKSNLWSTPTTFDHTNIKNPRKNHPGGGQKPPLQQQVNRWPTPRVSDTEGGVVKNVEKKNDSYSRVNKKGVRFGVKLKDAVGYEEEKLWPTPGARDSNPPEPQEKWEARAEKKKKEQGINLHFSLRQAVVKNPGTLWLTPIASSSQSASMDASKKEAERLHPKGQNHLAAEMASRTWPTPSTRDYKGGHGTIVEEDGKYYRVSNTTGTKYGARLDAQVEKMEADRTWPTPTTRDYKGVRKFETLEKSGRNENNSLPDKVNAENKKTAALNPDWVEWLMGYAPGYTDPEYTEPMQLEDHLGFESEPDIPRVTTRKEHRVNRLKCLGNSIVPQIMHEIGNAILADYNKDLDNG